MARGCGKKTISKSPKIAKIRRKDCVLAPKTELPAIWIKFETIRQGLECQVLHNINGPSELNDLEPTHIVLTMNRLNDVGLEQFIPEAGVAGGHSR